MQPTRAKAGAAAVGGASILALAASLLGYLEAREQHAVVRRSAEMSARDSVVAEDLVEKAHACEVRLVRLEEWRSYAERQLVQVRTIAGPPAPTVERPRKPEPQAVERPELEDPRVQRKLKAVLE